MCYRDNGARILVEETLQPGDRFRIEVVGGLIEQQHVRLREKQATQRDTATFTTREFAYVGIPGRQAQRIGRDFKLAIDFPPTGRVNRVLKFALFFEQRVHLVVTHRLGKLVADFLKAMQEFDCLAEAFLDVAAHILGRIQFGLLWEVADLDSGLRAGFAIDLGIKAGHDTHQCGFARPVEAEYADLGTREERE